VFEAMRWQLTSRRCLLQITRQP